MDGRLTLEGGGGPRFELKKPRESPLRIVCCSAGWPEWERERERERRKARVLAASYGRLGHDKAALRCHELQPCIRYGPPPPPMAVTLRIQVLIL